VWVIGWLCWPGQFSSFNVWLIRPGMTLERVNWLLGSPGQELAEKEMPTLQGSKRLVSGDQFYRWQADANSWRQGDFVIIGFESGVVREVFVSEIPLF
jgi:hypothetical protein